MSRFNSVTSAARESSVGLNVSPNALKSKSRNNSQLLGVSVISTDIAAPSGNGEGLAQLYALDGNTAHPFQLHTLQFDAAKQQPEQSPTKTANGSGLPFNMEEGHATSSSAVARVSVLDESVKQHQLTSPKSMASEHHSTHRHGEDLSTSQSSQNTAQTATGRYLWLRAVQSITASLGVARQFRTLRDMKIDCEVKREQLQAIRVLGQGAFAVVEECWYFATPTAKPQLVAVKRLKPHVTKNAHDIKSMFKEVALLRKLHNKNIVDFIGFGSWESGSLEAERQTLFMVEELVDGGNLKQMVSRSQRTGRDVYRAQDALRWLIQLAEGLKYLHQAKPMVIHRDLKLENILLAGRDVHTNNAKIADFGLSALVRSAKNEYDQIPREPLPRKGPRNRRSSALLAEDWTSAAKQRQSALSQQANGALSVAGQHQQLSGRTGTLMYMAPEVYRLEPYNEKADVYSFSMIAYELLHRYMMISATDGSLEECQAYARRVARAGYRPPIEDTIPRPLVELIKACWHPNPQQRPSMDEVVIVLLEIQKKVNLDKLDTRPGGEAYPNPLPPRPPPPSSANAKLAGSSEAQQQAGQNAGAAAAAGAAGGANRGAANAPAAAAGAKPAAKKEKGGCCVVQ